jgi:hypothetical protein
MRDNRTLHVDYSERDKERRFKILEGAKWNLQEARRLLWWVEVGDLPSEEMFKISEELRKDEEAAP